MKTSLGLTIRRHWHKFRESYTEAIAQAGMNRSQRIVAFIAVLVVTVLTIYPSWYEERWREFELVGTTPLGRGWYWTGPPRLDPFRFRYPYQREPWVKIDLAAMALQYLVVCAVAGAALLLLRDGSGRGSSSSHHPAEIPSPTSGTSIAPVEEVSPRSLNTVWQEGDRPAPVSPENPLAGLETLVLKTWLDNSPPLRWFHRSNPENRRNVEQAVREAVFDAHTQELRLRAQGLSFEQAQELTRPAMWTPPQIPTTAEAGSAAKPSRPVDFSDPGWLDELIAQDLPSCPLPPAPSKEDQGAASRPRSTSRVDVTDPRWLGKLLAQDIPSRRLVPQETSRSKAGPVPKRAKAGGRIERNSTRPKPIPLDWSLPQEESVTPLVQSRLEKNDRGSGKPGFEMDVDSPPSLEEEVLTSREVDAVEYWRRFLPERVKSLEAQGPSALAKAVRAAAWRTEYHILLAQAKDPKLHEYEAWTWYRDEWLYPPPEEWLSMRPSRRA